MLRLREKNAIDPNAIESIECDLKPYPLVRQFPTRGFEGRFSMPFCAAMALVHGRLDADDFTDENVRDPAIQDLMSSHPAHQPGTGKLTVSFARRHPDFGGAEYSLRPDRTRIGHGEISPMYSQPSQ